MAKENVFLFTGQEPYLLHQSLRTWKEKFIEKYSEQGVFTVPHDNLEIDQIQNALFSGGMFATRSLVIVHGIPRDTIKTNKARKTDAAPVEEFLMNNIDRIASETVLILVSYKPDKRTKMYKFLKKNAKIKEFKPLSGTQLIQFVNKELGDLVDNQLAEQVVQKVGTDLYILASECNKLKLFCDHNEIDNITPAIIQQVTYQQSETDSFAILDNIFSDPDTTLQLITNIQHEQPGEMFRFLGMMYRGLELVLQMADLHEHGITSSKALASKLKAHPFAVSKQLKKIDHIKQHQEAIEHLYHRLHQLDINIKTGQVPSESFWLEVKSSLLELSR